MSEHIKQSIAFSVVGFLASIILTVLAFHMADIFQMFPATMPMPKPYFDKILLGILLLALLQLVIQVRCFFRMGFNQDKDHWNLVSFLFTAIVLAIVVGGSLWIMHNLNENMMDPVVTTDA